MKTRRVPPLGETLQECDGCGQTWEAGQLRPQYAGLVCPKCYDKPRPRRVRPKGRP